MAADLNKRGAVIYCRVSTKEQLSNLSLEVQEARCRAYCHEIGWDVLRIFREAESAKTVHRTEFQEMLEFCGMNHKAVAAVVVYDGTRFSRETMDALQVEAILNAKGIVVRSATQPFDETPEGGLFKTLVFAYATYDNKWKAKKTIEGMKAAILKGLWVHKAPLGYVNIQNPAEDGPNLALDPDRAPLIRRAFEMYASGSYSKSEVLATVTDLGLRDSSGRPLSSQTFDKLLRKPVYAGWIVSSYGIRARGRFEPIVTEELFACVQDVMAGKAPNGTAKGSLDEHFPLRMFVRCGVCGTPLTGSISTGHGGKYGYYFCREKTCRAVKFPVDRLHNDFISLMESLRPRPEFWPLLEAVIKHVWADKHKKQQEAAKVAAKRIADLQELKDKLVIALVNGKLKQHIYDEQMDKVESDLEAAERQQLEPLPQELELRNLIDFARWVLENAGVTWLAAGHKERRRLQSAFFPGGLIRTKEAFGTSTLFSLFKQLEANADDFEGLASPGGFEPPLPP